MKRKKTKKETKKIQSENNTYLLLAKHTQHMVKRFQTNKEVVLKEPKNAFAYFMTVHVPETSSNFFWNMLFKKSEQSILSFFCQKRLVHIKINSKSFFFYKLWLKKKCGFCFTHATKGEQLSSQVLLQLFLMFVEKNNPSPKKSLVIGSKNTTAVLILQIKDFLIFIYCDGLRFESV